MDGGQVETKKAGKWLLTRLERSAIRGQEKMPVVGKQNLQVMSRPFPD
jgi:hypothetical protein